MQTRGRKIWRDVVSRKARTALVVTSIFIGVLGVVALISMGDLFTTNLDEAIQVDKLATRHSYLSINSPEPVNPQPYLERLAALPDVEKVQAAGIRATYWRLPDEDRFREGRLFTYATPLADVQLEPPVLYEGRWPESGQNEIAVERRLADYYDLQPGDTLTLRVLGDLENGVQEQAWTITGTVFMGYQYPITAGTPNNIRGEQMLFAQTEDALHITGAQGLNLMLARYTDVDAAHAGEEAFEEALTREGVLALTNTTIEAPEENSFVLQVASIRDVLGMLAIVSLAVSGFLVFNVINAMVIEQRRQIGVMKSLGGGGRDVFSIYAGVALVYGVLGVIPGVLAGIPLGFWGAQTIGASVNIFIDAFAVSPTGILTGIFMGLLVPLLASLFPIRAALRVTILEAMTDLGIATAFRRGLLSRLVSNLPFPIGIRQALTNMTQKRGRLALNTLTLAIAVGAFMGIYATLTSFNNIIDNIYNLFQYDVTLIPGEVQSGGEIPTLLEGQVEGVRAVEPGSSLAVEVEGFTPVQLGGIPAALSAIGLNVENRSLTEFDLREGDAWENDPERVGVVITEGMADTMGKTAGDTLTVRIGANSQEYVILGVLNYPFDFVFMRWEDLSALAGIRAGAPLPNQYQTALTVGEESIPTFGVNEMAASFVTVSDGAFDLSGALITEGLAESRGLAVGDTLTVGSGDNTATYPVTGIVAPLPGMPAEALALNYDSLVALEGITMDGAVLPNAYTIQLTASDPSAEEVADIISAMNEILLSDGLTATYLNWVENAEATSQLIGTAGVMLNTAAFLIAAVGVIGLFSTLSMSVFERQKEIGVMRSLGATSASVAQQFLVEGLAVGLLAWLIGVPLSMMINQALLVGFNFENSPGVGYPMQTPLIGLIGALLIASGASLWPSLSAARRTVSDILRYQ